MDLLGSLLPFIGSFNQTQNAKMASEEERRWQEEMYNKYNSPSALVRQYNEAGINPALMFGGSTPSMDSATSPAAVAESPTGSLSDMLSQLLGFKALDADIEEKRASAREKNANAANKEYSTELDRKFAEAERSYSIAQIIAGINRWQEETETTKQEREQLLGLRAALLRAQTRGENADAAFMEWKSNFASEHGFSPDSSPQTALMTGSTTAIDRFLDWLNGDRKDSPKTKERIKDRAESMTD